MSSQDLRASSLMLEECFDAADDRYLHEWIRVRHPALLMRMLERWLSDPRPWARQQLIQYLQQDLNFPGHEIVIKHLCKHLCRVSDHELLAHLMVAADRIVRRRRIVRLRRDRHSREVIPSHQLFARPNKTFASETGRTAEQLVGKVKRIVPLPDRINKESNRLFSHRTRNYLRRRVWRYFRWLSYRDADAFLAAITIAIIEYRDADFAAGENIIDNWSLMHACYFHSAILGFNAAHTNLKPGAALADLQAAPYQPKLWQQSGAVRHLMNIVTTAKSALSRVWAIELLLREHHAATLNMEIQSLLPLLFHADARVRQFASDVFAQHPGLANLPITAWLSLLEQCDPGLLSMICTAMKKHVSAARLDVRQRLQLTRARPVPVVEFGFALLKAQHSEHPLTTDELTLLSQAPCEALAGEIATWALEVLDSDLYQTDAVIEFFDSLSAATRSAAMDWLEKPASRGYSDPSLWGRLIETPFDDTRLRVVESLHCRTKLPGTNGDTFAPVWCAVILGVHRGGRTKLKAIVQMQHVIATHPEFSSRLLPVFAFAARSLRAPERRAALAAIATIAERNADLRVAIQQLLPELQWN